MLYRAKVWTKGEQQPGWYYEFTCQPNRNHECAMWYAFGRFFADGIKYSARTTRWRVQFAKGHDGEYRDIPASWAQCVENGENPRESYNEEDPGDDEPEELPADPIRLIPRWRAQRQDDPIQRTARQADSGVRGSQDQTQAGDGQAGQAGGTVQADGVAERRRAERAAIYHERLRDLEIILRGDNVAGSPGAGMPRRADPFSWYTGVDTLVT